MDTKPVFNAVNNALPDKGTVDRAAQSAHDAIDKVAAKAGPAVEKVRTAATGAADTVQQKVDKFSALEEEWVSNSRSYIRENPLTAVALGLLAGAILAKLSSSSR